MVSVAAYRPQQRANAAGALKQVSDGRRPRGAALVVRPCPTVRTGSSQASCRAKKRSRGRAGDSGGGGRRDQGQRPVRRRLRYSSTCASPAPPTRRGSRPRTRRAGPTSTPWRRPWRSWTRPAPARWPTTRSSGFWAPEAAQKCAEDRGTPVGAWCTDFHYRNVIDGLRTTPLDPGAIITLVPNGPPPASATLAQLAARVSNGCSSRASSTSTGRRHPGRPDRQRLSLHQGGL